MTGAGWAFAPTLQLRFGCDVTMGGATWSAGSVSAEPHDDAEGALAALIGDGVGCSALVAAWPLLLASLQWEAPYARIAPIGVASLVEAAKAGLNRPLRDIVANDVAVSRGDDAAAIQLVRARLELPDSWRAALVATAFAEAGAPSRPPEDDPLTLLATRILDHGEIPALRQVIAVYDPWSVGEVRGHELVALPASWFSTVWLVGAADIEDHLVLSLRRTGERSALARARSPLGREVTIPVHHDGATWALGPPPSTIADP